MEEMVALLTVFKERVLKFLNHSIVAGELSL
jgi:hypothetical protein